MASRPLNQGDRMRSPRVLVSWKPDPRYTPPFVLSPHQTTVGPRVFPDQPQACYAGWTPAGGYDLFDAVRRQGLDTRFDLVVVMADATRVNMPFNVAAFGAFVDIGVHQDGLVHISAMSKTFIKDPREVVKPGDVVKVKVLEVEVDRKRIALTLRMDDPVGAKADRPQVDRGPRFNDRQMTSPAKQDHGGALAEAMRRAAERGAGKVK